MVNQRVDIDTLDAERATFAMLAAFYNTNPDTNFLHTVAKLNPDDLEDEDIKSLIQHIVFSAQNTGMLLELKRDWTKLFRGVSPDYGPTPPYAQEYMNNRKLDVLSKLAAFYNEYGFTGHTLASNRQDYIGVLLDFAAHISQLRADAVKAGKDAEYERMTDLLEVFMNMYVSSWFENFCESAQKHTSTDFYKSIIELTKLMV